MEMAGEWWAARQVHPGGSISCNGRLAWELDTFDELSTSFLNVFLTWPGVGYVGEWFQDE